MGGVTVVVEAGVDDGGGAPVDVDGVARVAKVGSVAPAGSTARVRYYQQLKRIQSLEVALRYDAVRVNRLRRIGATARVCGS